MLNLNGIFNSGTNTLEYTTRATDRRVQFRTRAWAFAGDAADRLQIVYTEHGTNSYGDRNIRAVMERQIIATAVSTGFWSVWMTVFYNAVSNGSLTPIGENVNSLLYRLFVQGRPQLSMSFRNIDTDRIGIAAMGDIQ
jgi:hypothetical protein